MIKFLLQRPGSGMAIGTNFLVYIIDVNGYEMGIEALDNVKECPNKIMVTLFHWENEGQKNNGSHFANNEAKTSFLKVYTDKKGRYFNYSYNNKKCKVYIPV